MATLTFRWGKSSGSGEVWRVSAFSTLTFLQKSIPDFLDIASIRLSGTVAGAEIQVLILENKDPHTLEFFRVILPGGNDEEKLTYYIQAILKDKSHAFLPAAVERQISPPPHALALPAILVTLGIALASGTVSAIATYLTTKLLNKYGAEFFNAEKNNSTTINVIVVTQDRCPAINVAVKDIRALLQNAQPGMDGFPDDVPKDETWKVTATMSGNEDADGFEEDDDENDIAVAGDLFSGIAGLLSGLGGLANPVKSLTDLILEIKRGEKIDVEWEPVDGSKDKPRSAKFKLTGVRAKNLEKTLDVLGRFAKKQQSVLVDSDKTSQASWGVDFKESAEAKKWLAAHPA